MKRILSLAIAFVSSLTVMANNPEAKNTIKLSLARSIEIALSDNPVIKIAGLEIERQMDVRKETVSSLLPSLTASASYNRSIKKTEYDLGGGQTMTFEPDNTITAGVNLTLPLFAPSVYRMLSLNKEQMKAAVESARSERITLINEVKKAYYNILLAERSLEVLRTSEATTRLTVEQTRTLYAQGLTAEYDLITAQVQLSNLKPQIIKTINNIKTAKMLLKMYLYLPEDIDIILDSSLDEIGKQAIATAPEYITDLSSNTDIKQLDIQRNILLKQLKVSNSNRMPTLAAVANYQVMGRDHMSMNFGMQDGYAPKSGFEWFTPISAGLQLTIPIFSGLKNNYAARQIQNNISQIELQRDYLYESKNVEVRSTINDMASAREQINANRETVSQAQKSYDIANTRYKTGTGTILELNSAELSLTQARLNYTQSIYDYLAAQADYEKIIGTEK